MVLHEKQSQQALDFLRGFRLVRFPILIFTRRRAYMGAENVEDGLA